MCAASDSEPTPDPAGRAPTCAEPGADPTPPPADRTGTCAGSDSEPTPDPAGRARTCAEPGADPTPAPADRTGTCAGSDSESTPDPAGRARTYADPGADPTPATADRTGTCAGSDSEPTPAPAGPAGDPLVAAQIAVADVFGDIAAFWGFPRSQGRVFGMLVVAGPRPVPQREIRRVLGLSAGGASMALSSLARWGAVQRTGGGYVAQTDLWRIITGVFDRRERAEVDRAIARLAAARNALLAEGDPSDPACALALARMARLLEFFRAGRAFLDAFVRRGPLHGLLDLIARRAARLPTATGDAHVHLDA